MVKLKPHYHKPDDFRARLPAFVTKPCIPNSFPDKNQEKTAMFFAVLAASAYLPRRLHLLL